MLLIMIPDQYPNSYKALDIYTGYFDSLDDMIHISYPSNNERLLYLETCESSCHCAKKSLTTRCLAMLNTPEDVLYPQITTGVYGTPVLGGVVIVDIGHLQGCLAWLNTWLLVAFLCSVFQLNGTHKLQWIRRRNIHKNHDPTEEEDLEVLGQHILECFRKRNDELNPFNFNIASRN